MGAIAVLLGDGGTRDAVEAILECGGLSRIFGLGFPRPFEFSRRA